MAAAPHRPANPSQAPPSPAAPASTSQYNSQHPTDLVTSTHKQHPLQLAPSSTSQQPHPALFSVQAASTSETSQILRPAPFSTS
ncbi:hypothetical protein E2C01_049104 [Portunus trituberculatus]|uniref:Uncharacterized protein n=1 Tax=Portunus trituberculatus TaxID=210409 RepID=A0A5B7GD15_PORTR|nr:hypothetical protein [Portunus trituberculatus]